MLCYRQGDVLIVQLEEPPTATVSVPREADGRLVVAHGEATGHAHVVVGGDAELVSASEADDLYLLVYGKAALVHEEHNPIVIPPGNYQVARQREYVDDEYHGYVSD